MDELACHRHSPLLGKMKAGGCAHFGVHEGRIFAFSASQSRKALPGPAREISKKTKLFIMLTQFMYTAMEMALTPCHAQGNGVAAYRLYCLNDRHEIVHREDYDADDDYIAIALAEARFPSRECELWELGRKVATIEPKKPSSIMGQSQDLQPGGR
jgi:hypothetical protein